MAANVRVCLPGLLSALLSAGAIIINMAFSIFEGLRKYTLKPHGRSVTTIRLSKEAPTDLVKQVCSPPELFSCIGRAPHVVPSMHEAAAQKMQALFANT